MLTTSRLKAAMTALVATGAISAGAAYAQDGNAQDSNAPDYRAESPTVVERGPNGRATRVRVGETVYDVCKSEGEDSCIQPRAAGLGWGDRPLQHWPGRPASQMRASADSDRPTDR